MTNLKVINYNIPEFENIVEEINADNNLRGYCYAFKLEGEYEWEHQVLNKKVRLIDPVFVFKDRVGLFLLTKTSGRCYNNIVPVIEYLYHANISKYTTEFYSSKNVYRVKHFCTNNFNSMGIAEFVSDLDLNIATVKLLLPVQNPSSAYQSPTESMEMTVLDRSIQGLEYKKQNFIKLVTESRNPERDRIASLNMTDGYYVKYTNNPFYSYLKTKDELVAMYHTLPVSRYYKVIPAKVLGKLLEDMVFDYDIMSIGCGSSGSNVMWQLAKTKMIDSYMLLDKDMIYEKNLRNTTYDSDNLWNNKSGCLKKIVKQALPYMTNRNIDEHQCWLEDLFAKFNTEYLFSGVDKLTLRKELFEKENITWRYFIDAGYQGLSSSIYIIDREDEEQMEYYKNYLDNSIKSYVEDIIPDVSNVGYYAWNRTVRYLTKYNSKFDMCRSRFIKHSDKWFKEVWDSIPLKEKEKVLCNVSQERQTCQSPNIIDIYTITSGIIVGAIREIYNGNTKPFTHLELDTSTGIPLTMVVRK